MELKEFVTTTGEIILYNGQPDLNKLEISTPGVLCL
jgi:hypothetical protein